MPAYIGSSDEFVMDKYAVHAIPTVETNGCVLISESQPELMSDTHDLEL